MEKPSVSAHIDVESNTHSATQHGGGIPAPDDSGNVDDPPPIPSAGSSGIVFLNDKKPVGAREHEHTPSVTTIDDIDAGTIHLQAHTLPHEQVAGILETDPR